MTDCRLVLIEWEDSARPNPAWQFLDEVEGFAAVRCASVGWLVHDGDDVKALAPNMGGLDEKNAPQASGIITIPTRCVVSVKPLEEAE